MICARSTSRSCGVEAGRHVVLLIADPTKPVRIVPGPMLHPEDVPYFEELLNSTPEGADADIVVHSAGGLGEAAEQLSRMAKAHFREVRFVVPTLAQSAATILVLSGHRLMIETACLGPIDPQFAKPDGTSTPAQALTGDRPTSFEEPAWQAQPVLHPHPAERLASRPSDGG